MRAAFSKLFQGSVVFAFALLMLFPFLVNLIGLPKFIPELLGSDLLGGVEQKSERPEWILEDFLNGQFQKQFDQWFSSTFTLRSILLRNDNQLNFSLFNSTKKDTPLGKENFLFESFYVEDYIGLYPTSDEFLEQFSRDLEELQLGLARHGVRFLLFLTPSKATTYPELLPARFSNKEQGPRSYERLLPLLQARSISLLDGIAFAREQKKTSSYPIFPPGAAHWSLYTACLVTERLTNVLSTLLERETAKLNCDHPIIKMEPEADDMDLASVVNLWTNRRFQVKLPYASARVQKSDQAYLPNVIFIGDSFLTPILNFLEVDPIYASRDLFYYYRTAEHYDIHSKVRTRVPLVKGEMDWESILHKDVIILEINESRIHEGGYGFVADALQALRSKAGS